MRHRDDWEDENLKNSGLSIPLGIGLGAGLFLMLVLILELAFQKGLIQSFGIGSNRDLARLREQLNEKEKPQKPLVQVGKLDESLIDRANRDRTAVFELTKELQDIKDAREKELANIKAMNLKELQDLELKYTAEKDKLLEARKAIEIEIKTLEAKAKAPAEKTPD